MGPVLCSIDLLFIGGFPSSITHPNSQLSTLQKEQTCYDVDAVPVQSCSDDSHICNEINGHTYYTVHDSDCQTTKCVAQCDLDFLLNAGYECGPCPAASEAPDCYDVDAIPEQSCSNVDHICNQINGHTYYTVHLEDGSDCQATKCVAQSDLDSLLDAGYKCGPCGTDLQADDASSILNEQVDLSTTTDSKADGEGSNIVPGLDEEAEQSATIRAQAGGDPVSSLLAQMTERGASIITFHESHFSAYPFRTYSTSRLGPESNLITTVSAISC